jgi:biotin carboxylase
LKKKLLILGGNALNILAIKEANNYGFETYVVDKNPHSPGFEFAYKSISIDIIKPELIFEEIKNIGIDGIVSMAEAGIYTKAWLDEKLNLKNKLSINAALNATSKAAMRQHWAQIPEYSVPFFVVETIQETVEAINKLNQFPIIVKPDKSFGGSRGVSKIISIDQASEAFEFASQASFNKKVVIENCAEGDEFSCEVLVYNKKTSVLAIGLKVKSPEPYRVDYSVQYPAPLKEDQLKLVKDMCQKAILLLGIENGVAHVEFAYSQTGPKLFEIGARCGGGHTPIIAKNVSGVNEFIEYCNISCGIEPVGFLPKYQNGAEYRFIVFPEGKVNEISEINDFSNDKHIVDIVLNIKVGDILQIAKTTSDRLGCIVTTGDTLFDAKTKANSICKKITIHYENGTISNAMCL